MRRTGRGRRWPNARDCPSPRSGVSGRPSTLNRTDGFKLSNDSLFVEKVYDVVGLYLDPPEAFVVLCVNEKSPIQALARSQLAFPRSAPPATSATERRAFSLRSTSPTAPSFQAWIGVTGPLSSRSSRIDSQVPEGLEVHLVFDNYGTHKTRL